MRGRFRFSCFRRFGEAKDHARLFGDAFAFPAFSLALIACGSRDDTPPPPSPPASITIPRDAALAPDSDRIPCDREGPITLVHKTLKCRELPFDLELLEDGFVRTDATTITTIAKSFPDGTVWRAEIQPMLETITKPQLIARMTAAATAIEPKLAPAGEMQAMSGNGGLLHELEFTAPNGREISVRGWFFGGYLATFVAAGRPDSPTSASKLRGRNFVESLKPHSDRLDMSNATLALQHGTLEIPARAWRYTQMKPNPSVESRTHLFALPDLQATLGVRELLHPERCAEIATADPATFIASLSLGSLTIDTVARVTNGLRVTTRDDRPAMYYLLCRDGLFVQVMARGATITAPLQAIVDHAAESLRGG
jgi:hypothetical protein